MARGRIRDRQLNKSAMPNIASILKQEITRLSRKETRSQIESLKKETARLRHDVAALKKALVAVERQLRRQQKGAAVAAPASEPGDTPALRFNAKGFAAKRKALGLSAADAGTLLGVSGQSVYKWETGDVKPRAGQLPAVAAFRKLGKKQAAQLLDEKSS